MPYRTLDLPLGVNKTDQFVAAIMDLLDLPAAPTLVRDRGRLVDMMVDYQSYLYGKKVALWGDPDQMLSLTDFICSMGMRPVCAITGTPGKRFEKRMKTILDKYKVSGCEYRASADLFFLHQWIKNHPVDLLIGNTYGKHIARAEGPAPGPFRIPHPGPDRPCGLPDRGIPGRPEALVQHHQHPARTRRPGRSGRTVRTGHVGGGGPWKNPNIIFWSV